jgi:hypothetical protein
MQEVLPRELREMVYACLLADELKCDDTKRLDRDVNSSLYIARMRGDYIHATTFQAYPHFRDAEYIGMETKAELAETWYRLSRFIFSRESVIEDMFDKKTWGLELDA